MNNVQPRNGLEEKRNGYRHHPMEYRKATALEMAQELKEERTRLYSLAEAIRMQLEPKSDDLSSEPLAYGLAEILSELLADCDQSCRLIACLESMQKAVQ